MATEPLPAVNFPAESKLPPDRSRADPLRSSEAHSGRVSESWRPYRGLQKKGHDIFFLYPESSIIMRLKMLLFREDGRRGEKVMHV